jgi:site-specific DNA-methyltransferase (adenine-specific)
MKEEVQRYLSMRDSDFFMALGINESDRFAAKRFADAAGIPVDRLRYYNASNIFPSGHDLDHICLVAGLSPIELMLKMAVMDRRILKAIKANAKGVFDLIQRDVEQPGDHVDPPPIVFETKLGQLHQGDCLALLNQMESESIDMIFADPPFNLKKIYPSRVNDDLNDGQYLDWCESWAAECIRVLKPGGSLFLWNIPKWNTHISGYMNSRLTFRHWIAVDIKYSLPISGRLYPSHYALLYYCKGEKPRVFHPDRMPMEICPVCKADLRDYGGYKDKMNPKGVNLTDVWTDIAPVRHSKYKKRRGSNELSVKLMDRIIELASDEGDVIFDPFGGSGTTYVVSEIKRRRWVGIELGPVEDIVNRFEEISSEADLIEKIRCNYNCLFTDENQIVRRRLGLWTCESVCKDSRNKR